MVKDQKKYFTYSKLSKLSLKYQKMILMNFIILETANGISCLLKLLQLLKVSILNI